MHNPFLVFTLMKFSTQVPEHLKILAASSLEKCSTQMEVHSLQCNRYLI